MSYYGHSQSRIMRWTIKPSEEMEAYIYKLEEMGKNTEEMIERAVYPAAGLICDECVSEINSIPVIVKYGKQEMLDGLTADQKAGVLDGFGISTFQSNAGFVHVKLGCDGYNNTVTKRWPNGQPNAMILRSIENGTSFMRARHPINRATLRTRGKAVILMRQTFDEEVKKIMG